jgi:hypothetical protein
VDIHHGHGAENQKLAVGIASYLLPPSWRAKCRSGFATLPPEPLKSGPLWFFHGEGL